MHEQLAAYYRKEGPGRETAARPLPVEPIVLAEFNTPKPIPVIVVLMGAPGRYAARVALSGALGSTIHHEWRAAMNAALHQAGIEPSTVDVTVLETHNCLCGAPDDNHYPNCQPAPLGCMPNPATS
jgi:antitoxin component HigA of HigAB toxin-antitoxin module